MSAGAEVGEDVIDDLLDWLANDENGGGQLAFNIGEFYAPYDTDVNPTRIRMAAECFANAVEDGHGAEFSWPNVNAATAMQVWRIACEREDADGRGAYRGRS